MTTPTAAELAEIVRRSPNALADDLDEIARDDLTVADLIYRDGAGRIHLVFVREAPEANDIVLISDAASAVRGSGQLAVAWLVSGTISPDIEDAAIVAGVRTRQVSSDQAETTSRYTPPTVAVEAWPGRHALRRSVPETEALSELGGPVVRLVADLSRRGWEINHGGHQTQLAYAGHAVGGINRKYGHAYLSKLIGPILGDDHLRELGFKRKTDSKPRSAYAGHSWYEVRLPRDIAAFEKALLEIEARVDSRRP